MPVSPWLHSLQGAACSVQVMAPLGPPRHVRDRRALQKLSWRHEALSSSRPSESFPWPSGARYVSRRSLACKTLGPAYCKTLLCHMLETLHWCRKRIVSCNHTPELLKRGLGICLSQLLGKDVRGSHRSREGTQWPCRSGIDLPQTPRQVGVRSCFGPWHACRVIIHPSAILQHDQTRI